MDDLTQMYTVNKYADKMQYWKRNC